jgi:shikimate dehydrogenase
MPDAYALGLIGYPLEHSLSPRLHHAALAALGAPGEYRLYPLPPVPEGLAQLARLLDRLRRGELHGLNVTIPHKQNVIGLLDDLSPAAAAIGAVNTITLQEGCLCGENTDAPGFLADLAQLVGKPQASGLERNALVLGAGGSARAVVYALLHAGWRVVVAARRLAQARELVSSFQLSVISDQSSVISNQSSVVSDQLSVISDQSSVISDQSSVSSGRSSVVDGQSSLVGRPSSMVDGRTSDVGRPSSAVKLDASVLAALEFPIHLLVNATPLGMWPQVEGNPWPAGVALPAGAAVYDLVYNPPETALVKAARAGGLAARTGLGMLVEQAALALERWTGRDVPRQPMWEAVPEFVVGGLSENEGEQ